MSTYTPAKKVEFKGKVCPGVWEIKEERRIGAQSLFGDIYRACCENDCKYIAKFILHEVTPLNDIQKEIYMQEFVYKNNSELTIPIIEWFEADNYVVILMPVLQLTVREALSQMQDKESMEKLIQQVLDKTYELHSIGVYHGDAHMNNFMIDNDNVKIIDFGKSGYITTNKNKIIEDYQFIYISINSLYDGFNQEQRIMLEEIADEIENIYKTVADKINLDLPIYTYDVSMSVEGEYYSDIDLGELPDIPM
jgi:tRNA A-37 threonylcarbamoyl transferase component Bud32